MRNDSLTTFCQSIRFECAWDGDDEGELLNGSGWIRLKDRDTVEGKIKIGVITTYWGHEKQSKESAGIVNPLIPYWIGPKATMRFPATQFQFVRLQRKDIFI